MAARARVLTQNVDVRSNPPGCVDDAQMIVGTSTGALLAVALGIERWSLADAAALYESMASKVFRHFSTVEAVNVAHLAVRGARHSAAPLEQLCRTALTCGRGELLRSAPGVARRGDGDGSGSACHVALVATDANARPVRPFLFRNYATEASRYAGSCEAAVWQALRASTAAPSFFDEYLLQRPDGSTVRLQDGALCANNPTAVALHEAAAVFPGRPITAVCSIGTGRFQESAARGGWAGLLQTLQERATDTEGLDAVLRDVLPRRTYFRFNPSIARVVLSESDPSKLGELRRAARRYAATESLRLEELAARLTYQDVLGGWQGAGRSRL